MLKIASVLSRCRGNDGTPAVSQLSGSADNVPFRDPCAAAFLAAVLVDTIGDDRRFVQPIRTTHGIADRFTHSEAQFPALENS
jgi:hypothetical protein